MVVFVTDCSAAASEYADLDEATSYEFFEFALSQAPPHLEAQLRADAEGDWS